jgi:two-component system cell cycle sensor histidine kinase/response regulator CckA
VEHDVENKVGLQMGENVNSLGDVEGLKARVVEQADVIAKLQSHEERYRSILETTNAVGWELEVNSLKFTYMSPQIKALSGYAQVKWTDFNFWASKIHDDDRAKAVDWCTAETAKGLDHEIEYRMIRADGSTVWVRDVITVISEAGLPIFLRGYFFNIDDRKKAEERSFVLQATTYRSQKMESLGLMACGIAHDFNNLLTVILGNTELILTTSERDVPNTAYSTTPLLEDIQQAGLQAAKLIREMLTYAGRDQLELKDVNLNTLILDMWRLVESAHPKTVNLTHDLDDNLFPVLADPTHLQQVILNLIINASDAMGTNVGSIVVRTRLVNTGKIAFDESFTNPLPKSENCVVLEVCDTGHGINACIMEKLFEPFFSTKTTGRGLGLAIVQSVVRRHNGTISIRSEIGYGTAFSVYLPVLAQAHPKAMEKDTKNAQTSFSKGLILVVDDEDGVRDMANRILAHLGFSILCAPNGFEAVEIFKQHSGKIDCVLLDLHMPLISGEETLEKLRLIDEQVKVVLVSGNFDPEEASKLKVCGFVQKPYSMEEITKALSDAISKQM